MMDLSWHVNRLRAMSAPEIIHRAREQRSRMRWRHYADGWAGYDCGYGSLPKLPQLGDRLRAAALQNPALADRIATETVKLMDGHVQMLGQAWPGDALQGLRVGDPFLFYRDPVTGRLWPSHDRFCFDVPYRDVSAQGDIKFLWEINRLQFLQPTAAQAHLAGDGDLKQRVFDVILAWMTANPPHQGPNWASGIELSMRIVTLVIVLSFLGEPAAPSHRRSLRSFLNAHAAWLAEYPSRYSSANNHCIAEGLGLLLVGLLAPDLPRAAEFERTGRTLIEKECFLQILDDGVGVEQSPTYTAFALEMMGFANLAAALSGRPLARSVGDRLMSAAEHLFWMMNANGDVPSIGDNDEGRVLATSVDSERHYVCSVASCVAGAGGPPAAKKKAPEIREALFGVPCDARHSQLRGLRTFQEGGYSVIREDVAGRESIIVFDHGPLGYLSIAAHGHADALAVWLDVAGRPVLVDAGTWLYHAGGKIRDWLRSTPAHNTVVVEGASQSLPSGPFNWSHKAQAELVRSSQEAIWSLEAEHDGYSHRFGVRHVRRVASSSPGEITLSDRLEGGAIREVEINFLLAPDLTVSADAAGIEARRDDGFAMSISAPPGFEARLVSACPGESQGWISQRFGRLRPSTSVTFAGRLGERPAHTRIRLWFEGQNNDAC